MSLKSSEPFVGSRNGIRQITVVANGGTATLQALAGGKTGTPVPVTNGIASADGIITFYAMSDQWYHVILAGSAEAWLVG